MLVAGIAGCIGGDEEKISPNAPTKLDDNTTGTNSSVEAIKDSLASFEVLIKDLEDEKEKASFEDKIAVIRDELSIIDLTSPEAASTLERIAVDVDGLLSEIQRALDGGGIAKPNQNPEDPYIFDYTNPTPRTTSGRSSPKLSNYNACDRLESDLKESLLSEARSNLEAQRNQRYGIYYMDDMVMESDGAVTVADSANMGGDSASASAPPPGSERKEGEDYSGTNNQEEGVDEADFIKTDGDHIYLLNGGRLIVMAVPEFGQVEHTSNISIEGDPQQMLMSDNKIVIASTVNIWSLQGNDPLRESILFTDNSGYRWQSYTKISVVDITDRTNPSLMDEVYIEGYLLTGREVNGTVRMVTYGWIDAQDLRTWVQIEDYDAYWSANETEQSIIWNESINATINWNEASMESVQLNDLVPRMYERSEGGIVIHPYTSSDCDGFAAAADATSRGITSIISIDLTQNQFEFEADHIRSNWPQIYASHDMLVVTEQANDWWWFWHNPDFVEATNVHAFDISISGHTEYMGSGRINGTILDQFSLSEYGGVLRVASTTGQWGRWWMDEPEPMENHIICLQLVEQVGGGVFTEIGHLDGIAEGERIWSARFVGERAYLVTFRQVDPLWTIDIADPTNPKILGELEIPGVSTYIHPLSDGNHLLTIGYPGGEDGLGLDWSKTQISLFDVSDVSNPVLAAALPLTPGYTDVKCENIRTCGWSWSSSEATYEHKAFTFWEASSLLAVPLSTYRWTYDEVVVDGRTYTYYGYEYISKLVLVDVDAENGSLSIHGDVNHSAHFSGAGSYWNGDISIRRSIFMGEYIYAFSDAAVTVHWTNNLTFSSEVELPGRIDRWRLPVVSDGGVNTVDVVEGDSESGESESSGGTAPDPKPDDGNEEDEG